MITATVALPVYNSKNIVWLAMESLCRQKDINFQWEFIVCEEQGDGCAGEQFFRGYLDRIKEIGCAAFKYIPIETKIPLALKWRIMGRATAKTSVVFIPMGADDYTHPYKASRVYNALKDGKHTWYQCHYGYMYEIFTGKIIKYNHTTLPGGTSRTRSGVYFGTLTRFMRALPVCDRKRGVDGWLLSQVGYGKMIVDNHVSWKLGIFTNGLNNLSINRYKFFKQPTPPYVNANAVLEDIVPGDIAYRLRQMIPEVVQGPAYLKLVDNLSMNHILIDYTLHLHRADIIKHSSCEIGECVSDYVSQLKLNNVTTVSSVFCECEQKFTYRDPRDMKTIYCKLCLKPVKIK